jgi:hypothetical protein
MIVMICVGLLRHYGTKLLQTTTKSTENAIREQSFLIRCRLFRSRLQLLPYTSFETRNQYFIEKLDTFEYAKSKETTQSNPMDDPQQLQGTMDMMKKNMLMLIPQTLIMSWISFFFSGFVLTKLPFPLTQRFKTMLQSGIETSDMDVTWVSSLSWYFLNLFGLNSVYQLLLNDTTAGQVDMMMQQPNPMQQQNEILKMMTSEKEFMELSRHDFEFIDQEEKLLKKYGYVVQDKKLK